MRQALNHRLSYANVIATLALFVALSGGAYAAVHLQRNSVGAPQLKKGSVNAAKLKANAVDGTKVRDGSLTAADLAAGTIPAPQAPAPRTAPLKKGETITGVLEIFGPDPNAGTPVIDDASFPIQPPAPIPPAKQHFVEGESGPGCPGKGHADPGNLCVYRIRTPGPVDWQEPLIFNETGESPQEIGPFGFLLGVKSKGAQPFVQLPATWAYTAP